MPEDELPAAPAVPVRPAAVPRRYGVRVESGAFLVAAGQAAPIAFAETKDAAEHVAAALNLAAAIEEQDAA